jgi:hypothetical protein
MVDRILILISLGLLIAFCGVLVTFIGRIDLAVVIVICILMAVFDLLIYSFRQK